MSRKKRVVIDFERSSQTYFNEISKFKSLTKEEEVSLWKKYKKEHDLKARDTLIKSNLKFVANVAKPYIGMGLSYSDLIAEGNLGLMKAIEKFDYEKDVKTISYSVWWIRQTILEALDNRNKLNGEELPKDYEMPVYQCSDDDNDLSRDDSKYADKNSNDEFSQKEMSQIIEKLMGCLGKKEQKVVSLYYGLNGCDEMTLEEIGDLMHLSKERVRQIKEKAMIKLRAKVLENSLPSDIYI